MHSYFCVQEEKEIIYLIWRLPRDIVEENSHTSVRNIDTFLAEIDKIGGWNGGFTSCILALDRHDQDSHGPMRMIGWNCYPSLAQLGIEPEMQRLAAQCASTELKWDNTWTIGMLWWLILKPLKQKTSFHCTLKVPKPKWSDEIHIPCLNGIL